MKRFAAALAALTFAMPVVAHTSPTKPTPNYPPQGTVNIGHGFSVPAVQLDLWNTFPKGAFVNESCVDDQKIINMHCAVQLIQEEQKE